MRNTRLSGKMVSLSNLIVVNSRKSAAKLLLHFLLVLLNYISKRNAPSITILRALLFMMLLTLQEKISFSSNTILKLGQWQQRMDTQTSRRTPTLTKLIVSLYHLTGLKLAMTHTKTKECAKVCVGLLDPLLDSWTWESILKRIGILCPKISSLRKSKIKVTTPGTSSDTLRSTLIKRSQLRTVGKSLVLI